ncbi:MAG: OmpW family protein [Bacteroidetes bacterium]|nr:MAG: OmpW family protein [Bacteroidota bacterium]
MNKIFTQIKKQIIKHKTQYLIAFYLFQVLHVSNLQAQEFNQESLYWTVKTRLILTGSSDHSVPAGYMVYSSLSFEPSVARTLTKNLALELNIRIESHEIDSMTVGINEGLALGSVELIPINLIFQYRPFIKGNVLPYLGIGINYSIFWEKSGSLNSTDLSPGFGPSVQLGMDVDLRKNLLLNFQLSWNTLRTDIKSNGSKLANLKIDPLALGIGFGYRF